MASKAEAVEAVQNPAGGLGTTDRIFLIGGCPPRARMFVVVPDF